MPSSRADLSVDLRVLKAQDLRAFVSLRNASLQRYPDAFTSDYATEKDKLPEAFASRLGDAESGHFILCAFDRQGALLGTIAMERDKDVRPQKRHIAHVTAVMVSETVQRFGVATKLVKHCVELALANSSLDQLVLTVTASNQHVVRLYESAGFVSYGLLPRAILVQGQFFEKLHMRLDLAALRDNQHP
ncbi:GNAT family N-acetyltransferase [Variovorax sp. PCZ-1]|uniref:GNAT family N-acetyltransferase n=1 Tax=Variovorax sp. PCZ-1 TaxID=2835533 RepID=UPI001BCC374F|nr:GNAT family N-acetyltransferase [Variovorax sp. PCZ-1]MBS7806900.1 GNAT family N-acetyltransferase [Variovorax sp. PCZ-1]